jgi:drug/metabolite transporter (DMT)-like permease
VTTNGARFALLAATAVGMQVGAATVASRFVIAETTPAALAMMRYTIGFACLAPLAMIGARVRFAPRDLVPICLLGVMQFGALVALLNFGLQTVPAGRAALILATFPLLTMIFAAVLGREALSLIKTGGVLLSLAGVGIALGEKLGGGGIAVPTWRGEGAILAAAATGAICSVLYRPYLQRYPALWVSALAMLASVAALAVPAHLEGFFATTPRFTLPGWAAIAFIGTSSGIGYFLWLWALTHASPTRVTMFLALSPLTAGLLGTVLLGEPLTPAFLFGLAAVAAGLWLGTRTA